MYNEQTLEAYNKKYRAYIEHTPLEHQPTHLPLLRWIDASLSMLPSNGKILEIGSGTGREAEYMEAQGFSVQCSDGAASFVKYLESSGKEALLLNVLKDELPRNYDLIFANAVVPHFTAVDFESVLKKVHYSLNKNGLFALSAKQGEGETWIMEKLDEKRYIKFWQPDSLRNLLERMGFQVKILDCDIPGDLPNHTWINLTAQKQN